MNFFPSPSENFFNDSMLYQPAEAVLFPFASLSNETPKTSASHASEATIALANPYPVEAPNTSTLLAPSIFPFSFTYSI